ncbi:MAG TPA: hypothetical protein VG457_11720 [Planctomycetota bacterium]|jgi:hypothetical protein|nr:hypothetical protein [Planctomycetota bacterium]
MRYQIRLLDQNLPGLTREIAQALWHATDSIVRTPLDNALYRNLYRAAREVFRDHVRAFRYCNAARVCERSIPRYETGLLPQHEEFPGEHVHVYLLEPEAGPEVIVRELITKAVRAVARSLPGVPLSGLAWALRLASEKALDRRIFPSLRCGEDLLCHANEEYDPWDLRDPINDIRRAS